MSDQIPVSDPNTMPAKRAFFELTRFTREARQQLATILTNTISAGVASLRDTVTQLRGQDVTRPLYAELVGTPVVDVAFPTTQDVNIIERSFTVTGGSVDIASMPTISGSVTVSAIPAITGTVKVTEIPAVTVSALPAVTGTVKVTEIPAVAVSALPAVTGTVKVTELPAVSITGTVNVAGSVKVTEIPAVVVSSLPAIGGTVKVSEMPAVVITTMPAISGTVNVGTMPALTGTVAVSALPGYTSFTEVMNTATGYTTMRAVAGMRRFRVTASVASGVNLLSSPAVVIVASDDGGSTWFPVGAPTSLTAGQGVSIEAPVNGATHMRAMFTGSLIALGSQITRVRSSLDPT